jgi:hypothetical protein
VSTIFISYRRQDGISYALPEIKKKLESVFGSESVFFDLDIALGVNFADHIREHIVKSSVVLAFIGENWLGMAANGERRIDDQNDFVRIELALALREGKTVIPVFTGTAGPSVLDNLPDPVSALRFINGIEMRAGAMYAYQFENLIERLKGALGITHQKGTERKRDSGEWRKVLQGGLMPAGPIIESGLVLVFSVKKTMEQGRSAYDATRGWWRDTQRWEHAQYAVGIVDRISVCVVKIERWLNREEDGRRGFEGRCHTDKDTHPLLNKDFSGIILQAKGYWQFGNWLVVEFINGKPELRRPRRGVGT